MSYITYMLANMTMKYLQLINLLTLCLSPIPIPDLMSTSPYPNVFLQVVIVSLLIKTFTELGSQLFTFSPL